MGIDYAKPQEFVFAIIEGADKGKSDGQLTDREALVLSYIGMRSNRYGTCYPSRETIARATRSNKGTISHILGKFKRMGIIRTETKMLPEGRGRQPDTIVLNLKKGAQQGDALNRDHSDALNAARLRAEQQQGDALNLPSNKRKGQQGKDNGKDNGKDIAGGRDPDTKLPTVDGDEVSKKDFALAQAAVAAFNVRAGVKLVLLNSSGKPTEPLKRIVMRLRETEGLTAADLERIVNRSFDNPWWDDTPSIGVIFGPKVWDKAMANKGVRRNRSGRKVGLDADRPISRKDIEEAPW